nr:nucleotide sugar dehydrogenase [Listeria floridensis]
MPGKILEELVQNNRIIGGITETCAAKGKALYSLFVEGTIIETKASIAELAKLMENTYRDVNIALSNELVQVGEKLNINALEVIKIANQHPRVNLHQPGPGVGGHCLAVDPYFIVAEAPRETKLIQAARHVNREMPDFIVQQLLDMLDLHQGKVITLLGLSYKGNTEDVRESPAVNVLNRLRKITQLDIRIFDPHLPEISTSNLEQALTDSDLAVILTDHSDFKSFSSEVVQLMKNRVLFDTRNILTDTSDFDEIYTLGSLSKKRQTITETVKIRREKHDRAN